jgi:colanic acid/amylovoran biosynthesis protein
MSNRSDYPKVLIINVHSTCNAGDHALLVTTLQQLRDVFHEPIFTISSNWPNELALRDLQVKIIASPWNLVGAGTLRRPRWQILFTIWGWLWAWMHSKGFVNLSRKMVSQGWREVYTAYATADFVVAVPGNQFFSSGRYGWPLPLISMAVSLVHLYKKPLYVFPQSIGPFRRKWEIAMVRKGYGKARLVFLRDSISMQTAREIELPMDRVSYAPDPAFNLPPANREVAEAVLKPYGYDRKKPNLGVSLIARMPSFLDANLMEDYYTLVAKVLYDFAFQHGVRVFLFNQVNGPSEQEDDQIGSKAVLDRWPGKNAQIQIVSGDLSPELLKACYGCMDFFLASRLHAGIFAMGMGVPTLFIGYLSKTAGLLNAIGLQDWFIDLTQLDYAILYNYIDRAWSERQERVKQLALLLPKICEDAMQVGKLIAKDYLSGFE